MATTRHTQSRWAIRSRSRWELQVGLILLWASVFLLCGTAFFVSRQNKGQTVVASVLASYSCYLI